MPHEALTFQTQLNPTPSLSSVFHRSYYPRSYIATLLWVGYNEGYTYKVRARRYRPR